MPQKIDNLAAFDWDDSALIKAFDEGLNRIGGSGQKTSKEDKRNYKKKNEWKVGDFCRTVYYADGLLYEAKIIAISGDTCTIEFLGYDEEIEVDINSLSKSLGKKERKKQIRNANLSVASMDGSVSIDMRNERSVSQSPVHTHSKKRHHKNHMFNHSVENTAAENAFHGAYPMVHCNEMPSTSMMPPAPPIPQCSEIAQNPSLCAMITSWYMAGYYTGLHQAQKNKCHQHCCCRATQNFCHHSH